MTRLFVFVLAFLTLVPSAMHGEGGNPQPVVLWDADSTPDISGWSINPFENRDDAKNGSIQFTIRKTRDGAKAAWLYSRRAGRFNLILPALEKAAWQASSPSGIYVIYRTAPGSNAVRLMAGMDEGAVYGASLPPTLGKWRAEAVAGAQFQSRKETQPPDFSKLRKLYFSGRGSMDLEIARIALFCGASPRKLNRLERKEIDLPAREGARIEPDGQMKEKEWAGATVIANLPEAAGVADPKRYPAEVRLLRQGSRLCIGAVLKGETAPPVASTGDWQPVWKDSSFAVFLCPPRNGQPVYQFLVNSVGMRQSYKGVSSQGPRNWKAAATAKDGEWSLEMEIDLAALDPSWTPEEVWSANFARFIVIPGSGEKDHVALRQGWTQPGGKPATGLGLLRFSRDAPEALEPRAFLRTSGESTSSIDLFGLEPASEVRCRLFRDPGEAELNLPPELAATGKAEPVGAARSDFSFAFPTPRDGRYFLEIESLSRGKRRFDLFGLSFSRPSERKWTDFVLWPEPQKMTLREGYLAFGDDVSLRVEGRGDSFPGEFLADSLRRRYGVRVGSGEKPAIRLVYDDNAEVRSKEGYELEISGEGVSVRARSGRGMYYGIRALLDVCTQSAGSFGQFRARCLTIEDWPQVENRAMYHFLGARYQAPMSVETYKRFIYNEVAGGHYNLLFLCLNEAYRFDCAPDLASPTAWSRKDLEEIVAYARRHYVDICPALESPGHARWLVGKRKEYRYKGDSQTLDTGNPEAMKTLMSCYKEAVALFKPRYFHTGGDEVRWPPTTDPAELDRERGMLLAHWKSLHEFLAAKGIRMLVFDDMLSPSWNGGAPRHTSEILPELPRDLILTSWSDRGLDNPPKIYKDLGFKDHWRLLTSFDPDRADRAVGWWPDYQGLGIGVFTFWPWTTFSNHRSHVKYSTSAIHLNSMLQWKPDSLAPGAERIVKENGRCWSRLMATTAWHATNLAAKPLTAAEPGAALPEPWRKQLAEFSGGPIGEPPYRFQAVSPAGGLSAGGKKPSPGVKIGGTVCGLSFLHTAWASPEALKEAQARFGSENRNPDGLEIGRYEIAYADGGVKTVPIILGYNIQVADAPLLARAMEGSPVFWEAPAASSVRAENAPRAWVLDWVNPRPDVPVDHLRLISDAEDLPVSLIGLNAVRSKGE